MTSALVLGGGGTVGMAYHAGVLRALEEVGGFRPDDADLVVGTSAGSMVGAIVRSGLSTADLFAVAAGTHPTLQLEKPSESPWAAAWETPTDVIRRAIGSAYVIQRSLIRLPVPATPRWLRRLFPGGFHTIADAEDRMGEFMGTDWPEKPLWVVTVDVRTGRRVVLGRRNPPRTDLRTAVLASCAIPAFFSPIRVGHRTLVDGGVHSSTNLDLATKIRPDVIVAVVPMGVAPDHRPPPFEHLVRRYSNRLLDREIGQAEDRGAQVLAIRPTAEDLHAFGGLNMMRRAGNEHVAHVAYDSTVRQLTTPSAEATMVRLRAASGV